VPVVLTRSMDVGGAVFFGIAPPSKFTMLLRTKPVAIFCSVVDWEQIAGKLLDGELVERLVAVEGVDHHCRQRVWSRPASMW